MARLVDELFEIAEQYRAEIGREDGYIVVQPNRQCSWEPDLEWPDRYPQRSAAVDAQGNMYGAWFGREECAHAWLPLCKMVKAQVIDINSKKSKSAK